MAQVRAYLDSAGEGRKSYAALQHAAGFHCLVEYWKDCEELKPMPKDKWVSSSNRKKTQ